MENLKVKEHLPNTKEWCNTATRVLRDLIDKHNKLVEEVNELKKNQTTPPPNGNLGN